MERENQRIVITKRMLKESMLKLLKEKELDSINVTELCREAGVNRATFYRHYEIPRDVLMEIQHDLYRELRQKISLPGAAGDIRSVLEPLCIYTNDHQELLRILIQNNSDTDFASFINDVYLELVKDYRHMAALKKLSQEDIQFMTLYSAGGSYFVLRSWIMGSFQKSPQEMADYVYSLIAKTHQLILTLSEQKRNKKNRL